MNASNPVLELCADLIRRKSVTPDDAGCQAVLAERLGALGFRCESIMSNGVTNLWARWGTAKPLVVFAGHTDVVPPGPLEHWRTPPFEPTLDNDQLYGRGAADMKASLAAFVVAVEEFVRSHPTVAGSIALLITSDEEGPATDGTAKVCSILQQRGELPDYCLVGEPTSTQQLGDTIKNGRRGSLSGYLTVHGVQGHVAYPHLARNPIHQLAPALAELVAIEWDSGNEYFPATTFQIANLQAGTGATNVIPGQAQLMFNFRYAPVSTADDLQARVAEVLDRYGLSYDLRWVLSGEPFLTPRGTLSEALMAAIRDETGLLAELSTSGGTSDGRFIAKICEQVVEFGPINASIHQVNEHVAVSALLPLKNIYRRTLERLLLTHS